MEIGSMLVMLAAAVEDVYEGYEAAGLSILELGNMLAMIGAILAVALTGAGSAIGMSWVQQAAGGMVTEQPEKFGKTLILQLIPSSAALYGFVVGFLVLMQAVLGDGYGYTAVEGLTILVACLPIAIVGFFATLAQAKVCVSGVRMIGKDESMSGRAITMSVFIELFTLFALIVSVLSVFSIGG